MPAVLVPGIIQKGIAQYADVHSHHSRDTLTVSEQMGLSPLEPF